MAFLIRLLVAGTMVISSVAILCLIVWIINRGVQIVAEHLGYEVGDFFSWLRSKLPKRKRKKKQL